MQLADSIGDHEHVSGPVQTCRDYLDGLAASVNRVCVLGSCDRVPAVDKPVGAGKKEMRNAEPTDDVVLAEPNERRQLSRSAHRSQLRSTRPSIAGRPRRRR